MNIAETYDTYFLVLNYVDGAIEFWMTASFALVVASYLGAKHFKRTIRIIASSLYLTFSVSMFLRIWIWVQKASELGNILIENGEVLSRSTGIISGSLLLLVFLGGVFATTFFVWKDNA